MNLDLPTILGYFDRVVICGGPKSGKTHLCRDLKRRVIHTDDYADAYEWEELPWALLSAVRGEDRWVMEGVQAARALRKGLEADAVIYLDGSVKELKPRQEGLRKSVAQWFTDRHDEHPDVPTFSTSVSRMPATTLATSPSRPNTRAVISSPPAARSIGSSAASWTCPKNAG